MAQRDYYEILGVPKDVSEEKLKKAYRKVAMKNHPDRNPDDKAAEDRFKEAAEAYEILKDPQKRARYDRYGHAGVNQGGGGGFGGAGGMTMDDIFQNFGDIFGQGSPFEGFFGGQGGGGRGGRRARGERGSNLRTRVKLTLNEVAEGVKKTIKIKKQVTCDTCDGSGAKDASNVKTCGTCGGSGMVRQVRNTFLGQMATTAACPTCQGSGQQVSASCKACKGDGIVYGEDTVELDIPGGVAEGMQLSMTGRGNAGRRGGPAGDLLINIEELPHESLQRNGQDPRLRTPPQHRRRRPRHQGRSPDPRREGPLRHRARDAVRGDQAAQGQGPTQRPGPRQGRSVRARQRLHPEAPQRPRS